MSHLPAPRIDWSTVLGPILSQSMAATTGAITVDELEALDQALQNYPRRAVRPRPSLPLSALPFPSEAVPWFPRGQFVTDARSSETVRPGAFLQYAAGDYYIQDAGSMLALALCDVQPGQWVCDTCAAPGGKSSGLSEALSGAGLLVANEVIRSRLSILSLALARTGQGNHLISNLEIEALAHLCGTSFDCVLVDAPCSGQALVSRGKQSMAAFGPAQIEHSRQRQQRILRAAAGLVKSQGRLVYSTCAFSYAENEQVIADFLREHQGWRLGVQPGLDDWRSPLMEGCYRVWPHRDGCGGAFAALLFKTEDTPFAAAEPTASLRRIPTHRDRPTWNRQPTLPDGIHWVSAHDNGQWWRIRNQLHRFAPHFPAAWIESAVAGSTLAECSPVGRSTAKSPRWTPSYDAALLTAEFLESASAETTDHPAQPTIPPQPTCALSDEQASQYVLGQAVRLPSLDSDWCLVTWRGRRLSWGKLSQGILKNHFPKSLRQPTIVGPGVSEQT